MCIFYRETYYILCPRSSEPHHMHISILLLILLLCFLSLGECGVCVVSGWFQQPHLTNVRLVLVRLHTCGALEDQGTQDIPHTIGGWRGVDMSTCDTCSLLECVCDGWLILCALITQHTTGV